MSNSSMEHISVMERLIAKMAAFEAELQQGFRRLDEKMDRFQSDLHDNQIQMNDKLNKTERELQNAIAFKRARIDALEAKIETRMDGLETRVAAGETWEKVMIAKVTGIVLAITTFWVVFGPSLRHILGLGD